MSVLQAAFNSASTTPPCPLSAAKCSAVNPSCKDGGVSRQIGARMLHCCPYRESNTQIEEGVENQGPDKVYSAHDNNTNIMYMLFVCTESSSCMQCKQFRKCIHTHKHTREICAFDLFSVLRTLMSGFLHVNAGPRLPRMRVFILVSFDFFLASSSVPSGFSHVSPYARCTFRLPVPHPLL